VSCTVLDAAWKLYYSEERYRFWTLAQRMACTRKPDILWNVAVHMAAGFTCEKFMRNTPTSQHKMQSFS